MIRFTWLLGAMAATVVLAGVMNASALSISLDPAFQEARPGDTVLLNLVASDLGGEVIGTFDVDLSYDPNALTLDGFAVSGALGDLGLGDAFDLSFGDLGGGIIDIAVLSFLNTDPQELLDLQGVGPVILATLDFTVDVLAPQTSTFVDIASVQAVGNFDGIGFDNILTDFAEIRNPDVASPAPVPEPGTMLLFLSGILGLMCYRRRRNVAMTS